MKPYRYRLEYTKSDDTPNTLWKLHNAKPCRLKLKLKFRPYSASILRLKKGGWLSRGKTRSTVSTEFHLEFLRRFLSVTEYHRKNTYRNAKRKSGKNLGRKSRIKRENLWETSRDKTRKESYKRSCHVLRFYPTSWTINPQVSRVTKWHFERPQEKKSSRTLSQSRSCSFFSQLFDCFAAHA